MTCLPGPKRPRRILTRNGDASRKAILPTRPSNACFTPSSYLGTPLQFLFILLPVLNFRTLKTLFYVLVHRFLRASVNKFFADALAMVSPQIMSLIISFVAASQQSDAPSVWVGVGLAFAMFCSAFLQTTLTNSYMNTVSMFIICFQCVSVLCLLDDQHLAPF